MKVSSSLLGRDGRDIWDRVFLQRGEKWAKFGDMLILDSPLVCWTGLINAAPRHRELAEAGQEQSSCFLRRPSTKFSVVQWPRHKHLVGSTPEKHHAVRQEHQLHSCRSFYPISVKLSAAWELRSLRSSCRFTWSRSRRFLNVCFFVWILKTQL